MAREDDMEAHTERWVDFELLPPEQPHRAGDPLWLTWALNELGEKEVPGDGDNERIRFYHLHTAAGEAPDAVPWCSSFVNAGLYDGAGIIGTRSKAARSWLSWKPRGGAYPTRGGLLLTEFRRGCLVVFSRGEYPQGHVAFGLELGDRTVDCCGGNQSDSVSIARYQTNRVLGYVWPVDAVELLDA